MAAEAFTIHPFTEAVLASLLANDHCSEETVKQKLQFGYLVEYLKAMGTVTVVVENVYVDREYLEDYSTYYSRCFRNYSRICRRLHFFSKTVTDELLRRWVHCQLDSAAKDGLASSYLGFTVARPLPHAVIGRTVLKPYPSDEGRRHYPAISKQEVGLFGIPLAIDSMPFQEQDTVVAACATVALWSCLNKTRDSFPGAKALTPAEVTRSAHRVGRTSRPMPSHGLDVGQICDVVRDAGLEAEVFEVTEGLYLPSLLYAHLKDGFPALLGGLVEGEGLHAIVVNGYSILKKIHLQQEIPGSDPLPLVARRIDEFYTHDDGSGPFAKLTVHDSTTSDNRVYPVVFECRWKKTTGGYCKFFPTVVVIPVYHKIRIKFQDVQGWLARLTSFLNIFGIGAEEMEWDVWLTTVNKFKNSIRTDDAVPPAAKEKILFGSLPRWLWRCVLRVPGGRGLELLVDATDLERSFPICEVIWYDEGLQKVVKAVADEPVLKQLVLEYLSTEFVTLLKK